MEINILNWKTTAQVKAMLNIASSTLAAAAATGRIPPDAAVKSGRDWHFDVDNPGFQEYLNRRPAPGRGPKKKAQK